MEPTAKRARVDTLGDAIPTGAPAPQHSTEGLENMLAAMPNATHLSLITEAATRHADIMAMVKAQYEWQLAREAASVISFDHYSKEAWHELNTKYDSLSGSKQYDMAFEVAERIGEMLKNIADNTKVASSFGTKLNAIETIRKIYKSALLADDTLGHYLRQNLGGWGDNLVSVAKSFRGEELDRLSKTIMADNALWLDKFEEVANLARSSYVDLELSIDEALLILQGHAGEDEEEEDEGNGGEYSE